MQNTNLQWFLSGMASHSFLVTQTCDMIYSWFVLVLTKCFGKASHWKRSWSHCVGHKMGCLVAPHCLVGLWFQTCQSVFSSRHLTKSEEKTFNPFTLITHYGEINFFPPWNCLGPLLRFSQTCKFWSSKANWRLHFLLLSIISMDLLGNKTLL